MGFEDYVSDVEAANIAGVSLATLKRFVEAGYLTVESDNDGLRLYSREQVLQVFRGANAQAEEEEVQEPASVRELDVLNSDVSTDDVFIPYEPTAEEIAREEANPHLLSPPPGFSIAPKKRGRKKKSPEENTSADPMSADEVFMPFDPSLEEGQRDEGVTRKSSSQAPTGAKRGRKKVIEEAPPLVLLEKMLEEREREIQALRDEREWLRSRVERLEDQSEKDKVLLLSEAQTVRRLVEGTITKKSRLRSALEYLGFLPPTPDNDTIELTKLPSPANSSEEIKKIGNE